ncbi:head GIN domain-containing protein [Aquimarina sp. 2201CG14-23]|uniref:head GIN domain-containing protein n=1 Tax=Aquimarina mycalae TaxID=3040073 RepID=UPI002477EB62|nr:head GIN domain-containing protein [Aquimarina sp. 2201CG14-23]MDH7446548.1 head GIN domain-containing protein [Aquimarina sp. 2201CG14-23]
MRTVLIILSVTLCSITSIHAQWWGNGKKIEGDGNEVTKTRSLSEYDQVKVKGSLDVSLVSGTEGKIKIEGESNLIPYIVTEIEGEALKIYVKKGYYLKTSRGKQLLITVPFRDLNKVSLSGSGDVFSDDTIKANSFKTSVSGSGDVRLAVEANELESSVSGSGDLTLKGIAENLECNVTGSGDVKAYDLKAKNVDASVTGSGDIKVTSTYSLKARVTGSGDIDYQGNPEKEDKKVSGSGDITKH